MAAHRKRSSSSCRVLSRKVVVKRILPNLAREERFVLAKCGALKLRDQLLILVGELEIGNRLGRGQQGCLFQFGWLGGTATGQQQRAQQCGYNH